MAPFTKDNDAVTTLERFLKYLKRVNMVFSTEDIANEKKKKSFLQIWGGDDMVTLFEHVGKVQEEADTFEEAMKKITDALKGQINEVYPVYKLFCEMPQGRKSFSDWYPKVLEQAQLCNFDGYTAEKAARDAMTMQTENHRLRKCALAEGPDFQTFVEQGLALESATTQAKKIEKSIAAYHINRVFQQPHEKRVHPNQNSNQPNYCDFCGYEPRKAHKRGRCPAKGKKSHVCDKKHHFSHAKVCPGGAVRKVNDRKETSDSDTDEITGRIKTVNHIAAQQSEEEMIKVKFNGYITDIRVDSGCHRILLPEKVYHTFRHTTRLVKTKVKLRPYGIKDNLTVVGRAKVIVEAECGQKHETWAYIVKGHMVEALLGSDDAKALGVLKITPAGELVAVVSETVPSRCKTSSRHIQFFLTGLENSRMGKWISS